jgi:cephalosporin hydroxylase
VLGELRRYAPLVTPDSYVVVMDTIMEYLPEQAFAGKPYGKGNNPATAARAFLAEDERFEVDHAIEDQVIMTLSPDGFLRRSR